MYQQSDIERAKAEAYSSAADTACNEWNRLERTNDWWLMTRYFKVIWQNLKGISEDYHKAADELVIKEKNDGTRD